jgi:hypothetical protein
VDPFKNKGTSLSTGFVVSPGLTQADPRAETALRQLFNFRPERVLFRTGGVNLRACLCGVPSYASAQALVFLDRTKNPRFPNRKQTVPHPVFPDGTYLYHPDLAVVNGCFAVQRRVVTWLQRAERGNSDRSLTSRLYGPDKAPLKEGALLRPIRRETP